MKIYRNKSLKKLNTFNIDANANYFVSISNEKEILDLLHTDIGQSNKRFVLGGGSNVLFRNDYDGLIISLDIQGMKLIESKPDYSIISVGAGEIWHNIVETCVLNNYYGIENLAYIPGKVGAAPVQNIGAYGLEQSEYFHSLSGVDLNSGEVVELCKDDCKFGYRDSVFKNKYKDTFIVTNVRYKLARQWKINLKYAELARELEKFNFIEQNVQYVMNTVVRIRKQKLPEPKEIANAGSFFKNPIIDEQAMQEIKSKYPDAPIFPVNSGKYKISAAWLIEKCGWKGVRRGDAGVYEKHSLILVNHRNAKGEDIYNLSEEIINDVEDKYNIELEREVIVV